MAQLSRKTNFCLQGHQQGNRTEAAEILAWVARSSVVTAGLQSPRFISFSGVLSGV